MMHFFFQIRFYIYTFPMGLKNRGGGYGEKIAILDFIYRQYVISPHTKFLLQSDGDRQTQLFLRNFFLVYRN